MTGSIDGGKLGEAALVSGITAGLLNGITYSSSDGLGFTTGNTVVGGSGPQSLANLAGLQNLSNAMSPSASGASASVSAQLAACGAANLTSTQRAEIVGLATLLSGTNALLSGVKAVGGATSAENEALNNSTDSHSWQFEKHESPPGEADEQEKSCLPRKKWRLVKRQSRRIRMGPLSCRAGDAGGCKRNAGRN